MCRKHWSLQTMWARTATHVGVYVGCMWAHEFVEVLPRLVSPTCLAQCMQACCCLQILLER